MEKVTELMSGLIPFAILLVTSAIVSGIFYFIKRRDLFGGFIGGIVIAICGALLGIFIGEFLLDYIIIALKFLVSEFNINIIAAFLGAYIAVSIMNKLNHNKKRDKY